MQGWSDATLQEASIGLWTHHLNLSQSSLYSELAIEMLKVFKGPASELAMLIEEVAPELADPELIIALPKIFNGPAGKALMLRSLCCTSACCLCKEAKRDQAYSYDDCRNRLCGERYKE